MALQYNILYKCCYNNYNDDPNLKGLLDSEGFTKEDRFFLEDRFYQYDLLTIFQIETNDEFEESIINPIVKKLFEILKEHEGLVKCMKHLGEDDLVLGLMFLFSADYLYLSHPCFSEYLQNKTIDPNNFALLEAAIFLK